MPRLRSTARLSPASPADPSPQFPAAPHVGTTPSRDPRRPTAGQAGHKTGHPGRPCRPQNRAPVTGHRPCRDSCSHLLLLRQQQLEEIEVLHKTQAPSDRCQDNSCSTSSYNSQWLADNLTPAYLTACYLRD